MREFAGCKLPPGPFRCLSTRKMLIAQGVRSRKTREALESERLLNLDRYRTLLPWRESADGRNKSPASRTHGAELQERRRLIVVWALGRRFPPDERSQGRTSFLPTRGPSGHGSGRLGQHCGPLPV